MLPPDPAEPNDVDDLLRRYWAGEKQLEGPIYEALIPPMRRIAQRQLAEHAKNYAMVQKTMIAIDTIQKLLRLAERGEREAQGASEDEPARRSLRIHD